MVVIVMLVAVLNYGGIPLLLKQFWIRLLSDMFCVIVMDGRLIMQAC